ncbi:MAG: tachylectin-related carbohydrate-binding protein [Candidatus Nanopelagicales bacterium]
MATKIVKLAILRARHDTTTARISDDACVRMLYHSPAGRAVLDYWSDVTGGYLDFQGSALLPWVDITLPPNDVSRGTQFTLAYAATDALSPNDDLSAYDGYVVLSLPGIGIDGGSSTSSGRRFSALPVATSDHTFMCHELGHTMGFGHSYGLPNNGIDWDGKAPWDVGNVYGDPYDIMSSGAFGARWLDPDAAHTTSDPTFGGAAVPGWPNRSAFSMGPAPARAHLHLWDPAALQNTVQDVTIPAAGQSVKGRLQAAGGSAGPIKLLVLHPEDEDAQGRGRCYVEYRQATGWDAGLDSDGSDLGRQAVVVHALADTPDEGVRCWYRGQLAIPLASESVLPIAGTRLVVNVTALGPYNSYVDIEVVNVPDLAAGLKQVFADGTGVIYAILDNGDLMWYHHDGRGDGSFHWTGPRKVGVGWDVKQVFSGGEGVIYTVTHTGDLMWYRHEGRGDGSFRWAADAGRKVGTGWDVKQIFSGGEGVIYTVTHTGDLMWYRHEGRGDGSFRWAADAGRKVGSGWDVQHIFSGGGGLIYTVNALGDLLWYRHEGRADGSFRWAADAGRKVGTGWDVTRVFAGGDGVIYTATHTGDLNWFRHDGRGDGSFRWAADTGRKVGVGWTIAADAIIYTVTADRDLLWYRHAGRGDGSFQWAADTGKKVGAGWAAPQVFSGGDGVVYAILADGDLLWYRHTGRGDGSFRWAADTGKKVGTGWNVKQVFSGGGGIIYAVLHNGDLIWNRHDGRGDGTPQWAADAGKKVGTGWNVTHIFAGEGGVIYTLNDAGELLWYRHDGYGDGTFRWAADAGKKVGTGWHASHVFPAGDGIIYAVLGNGDLIWNRHYGRGDGSFRWAADVGKKVGTGWNPASIFSGGPNPH